MFDMIGTYASRKVGRFKKGELIVSTCAVTDGDHPYETGVKHPEYNDGDWVITESYDTAEEAKEGHDRWVKTMTSKELPKELTDCQNSAISKLIRKENLVFKRGRTKN